MSDGWDKFDIGTLLFMIVIIGITLAFGIALIDNRLVQIRDRLPIPAETKP